METKAYIIDLSYVGFPWTVEFAPTHDIQAGMKAAIGWYINNAV